jgi:hypothetical protein
MILSIGSDQDTESILLIPDEEEVTNIIK